MIVGSPTPSGRAVALALAALAVLAALTAPVAVAADEDIVRYSRQRVPGGPAEPLLGRVRQQGPSGEGSAEPGVGGRPRPTDGRYATVPVPLGSGTEQVIPVWTGIDYKPLSAPGSGMAWMG